MESKTKETTKKHAFKKSLLMIFFILSSISIALLYIKFITPRKNQVTTHSESITITTNLREDKRYAKITLSFFGNKKAVEVINENLNKIKDSLIVNTRNQSVEDMSTEKGIEEFKDKFLYLIRESLSLEIDSIFIQELLIQ